LRPATKTGPTASGNIALSRADGASMFFDVLAWGFLAFVLLVVIGLLWLAWLNGRDEVRRKTAGLPAVSVSDRGSSA
jgi:hypothetical protein